MHADKHNSVQHLLHIKTERKKQKDNENEKTGNRNLKSKATESLTV